MEAELERRRWRLVLVAGGLSVLSALILCAFALVVDLSMFDVGPSGEPPTPKDLVDSLRAFGLLLAVAFLFGALGVVLLVLGFARLRELRLVERTDPEQPPWN